MTLIILTVLMTLAAALWTIAICMIVEKVKPIWAEKRLLAYIKATHGDVKVKAQDFASWYTKEAQDDIAKFVSEKRGQAIRRRIVIDLFKAQPRGPKGFDSFRAAKALVPPAMICAHLSDSYLNKYSLAA